VPRTRPPYPEEFRREAIELVRISSKSQHQICGGSRARDPQEGSSFFRPGDRRAVGEIFSLIAAEKANFPVSVMCRALGVNRTSVYDWERRAPSDRALRTRG
jgi:transposase-like protein